MNKLGVQHEPAGIVLSLADKHVMVARQVVEFRMQHIGAGAPAKMGCCVRDCHEDRVTPGLVPDEKPIGIWAAVGSCTKVHDEGVVKLIREARVSRLTAFPQLAGLASGNLHNPGLIVLRTY